MSCQHPGFSLEKTNQPVDHGDSRCWNFHLRETRTLWWYLLCLRSPGITVDLASEGWRPSPGSPPLSWWGSRSVNNMSPFYSRVKREYIKSILKEAFRNPHGVDFGSGIFVGRQVNLSGVLSFFGVSLPNGKTN